MSTSFSILSIKSEWIRHTDQGPNRLGYHCLVRDPEGKERILEYMYDELMQLLCPNVLSQMMADAALDPPDPQHRGR